MGKILVFVEHQNGQLKRSAQELLSAATKSGQPAAAVVFGSTGASVADQCAGFGVSDVLLFKDASLDQYNAELFTAAMAQTIEVAGAKIVLGSASSTGRDLLPRVAAKLNSGVLSDCTELNISGDSVTVKKPIYSGKAFAKAGFESSPVQFVLMRANQLPISSATNGAKAAIKEMTLAKPDLKTLVKAIVKGASEKLDLTEANIVVSGGRGLKEAGNFKLLNELAEVLGGTVGASRAVVDAGWVGHGMQVGQTGKTVAPTLYIAVGISGAIQHLAGMSGSKVIVAINSDPNAPIFQKATYGIVGDLFDVLPKLTAEFKKALN
jgi:electron transfer flavoprotein alpha subunit